MKKRKTGLLLILPVALLLAISVSFDYKSQLNPNGDGFLAKLLTEKIVINSQQSEEKEIAPLFYNFLSNLIYKFAK